MKIAVATDDGKTISRHFGRANGYLVFTVEARTIVGQEPREKAGHQQHTHDHDSHTHEHGQGHGFGEQAAARHTQMIEPIQDCEIVIVRGMGQGAYLALQQANIRPIVTDIEDAESAILAYIGGTLVDHPEWLH